MSPCSRVHTSVPSITQHTALCTWCSVVMQSKLEVTRLGSSYRQCCSTLRFDLAITEKLVSACSGVTPLTCLWLRWHVCDSVDTSLIPKIYLWLFGHTCEAVNISVTAWIYMWNQWHICDAVDIYVTPWTYHWLRRHICGFVDVYVTAWLYM